MCFKGENFQFVMIYENAIEQMNYEFISYFIQKQLLNLLRSFIFISRRDKEEETSNAMIRSL